MSDVEESPPVPVMIWIGSGICIDVVLERAYDVLFLVTCLLRVSSTCVNNADCASAGYQQRVYISPTPSAAAPPGARGVGDGAMARPLLVSGELLQR